ncbi:hypothetical protein BP5796_11842 [Coleophoma crateriformis]|uniref:2EXR domain-containing protein n=1 Tax=Coleophoma crateriformis TaxID=565419 RepID=A0A3D8QEG6_9HELO|nr:hypothetical protein BP5796_11842 [Coleophoma crateriformis]
MKLRSGKESGDGATAPIADRRVKRSSKGHNQPNLQSAPETFHSFANLPAELRTQIWQLSIQPRMLYFHRGNRRYKIPLPAILHACHESRVIGKSMYQQVKWFANDHEQSYFNFKDDAFLIHDVSDVSDLEALGDGTAFNQIQHISIAATLWAAHSCVMCRRDFAARYVEHLDDIRDMASLKTISIFKSSNDIRTGLSTCTMKEVESLGITSPISCWAFDDWHSGNLPMTESYISDWQTWDAKRRNKHPGWQKVTLKFGELQQ